MRTIVAVITTIGIVGITLGMGTQLVSLLMTEKGISNSTIGIEEQLVELRLLLQPSLLLESLSI
ncbi:hypothetical protein GCM10023260_01030 [Bartonella acomydis]|uniref:Uncharacterized protein n=1 Tax=Bartonella acomydis TaxID=686234 RepID=A0ABP9MBB8_9HYPH